LLKPGTGDEAASLAAPLAASPEADTGASVAPNLGTGGDAGLEADLRQATALGAFELDYQAQFDTGTRRITGFEALLRWTRHGQGRVAPDIIIPIAERAGLIGQIGGWVLRRACRDAMSWPEPITLAVNLSSSQFDDGLLVPLVEAALAESGLQPGRLELEITESTVMRNTASVSEALARLRRLGVRIVLDDFGTGYSALSYLSNIPVGKVKIDRSFVAKIVRSQADNRIIAAIIRLCSELGVACNAEGVETEEQLAELVLHGCGEAQGFLLSRPVAADAVPALLVRHGAGPAGSDATQPAMQSRIQPGHQTGTHTSTQTGIQTGIQTGTKTGRLSGWRQDSTHFCFEQIVATANDIVIVTTTDLDRPGPSILYVNEAFTRLTGYRPEEVLGRSPRMLQGPGTSRAALDRVAAGLRAGQPVSEKILNYAKDGSPYWLDLRIVPMRDAEGEIVQFVAIQRDVTLDTRRLDELRTAAERDALTGIPNRRFLLRSIETALRDAAGRNDPCLCLAYLDIDRFKAVNDTLGHAAGDALLFGIAGRLVETVRRIDLVGRIGGDEFAVCMPSITAEDALATIECLRRSLATAPFDTQAGPVRVTVSAGIAVARPGEQDVSALMERADRAMYAAKHAGRDRVVREPGAA
jgi:diguanylate cyclase (GGDEF)-like protein/PAS domain S-box-containing protein